MCGIAGFYAIGSELVSKNDVFSSKQALDTLKVRGPDAFGDWSDERCELLHTRLAILDLHDRSNQPTVLGKWILSYNGEIYNYKALRAELKRDGRVFDTEGDTEVLLQAIDRWGVDGALDKICGMFAFAAYDREAKQLHIARDRMGIKPVYIFRNENYLVFASNCATIVNGLFEKKWELDWGAVQSFFMLGTVLTENSLFKGIRRLKPAEHVVVEADGRQTSKIYWQPRLRDDLTSEEIVSIIQEHSASDVPIASFLSGGIDSSAVSVALKNEDMIAVHLDSPEKRYAQIVADSIGINCEVSGMPVMDDVDGILDHHINTFGEPSSTAIIAETTVRSCVDQGVKVGILGNGGDELFLGYPSTPIPELKQNEISWNRYTQRPFSNLNQQLRWIMRSPELFKVRGIDNQYYFEEMRRWISDSMFLDGFPASASHRWVDLQVFAIGHLNITSDIVSMASSMELRVPFLDHRMVEGALSMDANKLVTTANGRKSPLVNILRQNNIPPTVWQREKLGFSFDDKKLKIIDTKRHEAMRNLEEQGIIENHTDRESWKPNTYNNLRDEAYLIACAHSFSRWLHCWESRLVGI